MSKDNPHAPRGASGATGHRVWLMVLLALMASVFIVGAVISRADDESSSSLMRSVPDSEATATTLSPQAEVASRLREILSTRDRALLARNAALLSKIYTVDCSCLKAGRALIAQLRKERIIWKGVETDIAIKSSEEVNDRLWIIIATVRTPSVRVETETGRLVRVVPPEQNVVRFALARPAQRGRVASRPCVEPAIDQPGTIYTGRTQSCLRSCGLWDLSSRWRTLMKLLLSSVEQK